MKPVNWSHVDNEEFECFIDPNDGGEPICFWWEDMRPREIAQLVKYAYERGVTRSTADNGWKEKYYALRAAVEVELFDNMRAILTRVGDE